MSSQRPFSTRRFTIAAPLALALLGAAGCGGEEEVPPVAREARAITSVTPELEPVVEGNNAFALSLYRAASASPENLFFSPFSVSAAFGMTYAGAREKSAEEMREVLELRTDDASYHEQFGALIADLGGEHPGRGYQLLVANRLFGQKGSPFEKPFVEITSEDYGAPLDGVDFMGDTEGARLQINDWVAEQTSDEIPELFDAGQLDGDTRLVLANAIYFDAAWAKQFDPTKTQKSAFTLASGKTIETDMMSRAGVKVRSVFREDVSAMEMSYQDDEVSMVVLLPPKHDGLPALEALLDEKYLSGVLGEMHEGEIDVTIPKFTLEAELPLKELLVGMGMASAFDETVARDFAGILDPQVEELHIQKAIHRARIRVDERGTVAAAATGVGVGAVSLPPSIIADHPFVYLIRDRLTGSILFAGRVADPTQQKSG